MHHTEVNSRRGDGSVALLSCRVPDLSLYRLAIHLNAARGELHADSALTLQVELIPRESREKVALPDAWVPNQHNCEGQEKERGRGGKRWDGHVCMLCAVAMCGEKSREMVMQHEAVHKQWRQKKSAARRSNVWFMGYGKRTSLLKVGGQQIPKYKAKYKLSVKPEKHLRIFSFNENSSTRQSFCFVFWMNQLCIFWSTWILKKIMFVVLADFERSLWRIVWWVIYWTICSTHLHVWHCPSFLSHQSPKRTNILLVELFCICDPFWMSL